MNIKFKYSPQYEKSLNLLSKEPVFVVENIDEKLELMTQFWMENGDKIHKAFEEITGLKFGTENIPCYLNTKFSLSDPLSLRIESIEDMEDNLIHELCHNFFSHNYKKISKGWKMMFDMYPDEPLVTKSHIGVHALHYLVTEKLAPERLLNIMGYSKKIAYIKAWDIVKEKTPKYFIDLITKNDPS